MFNQRVNINGYFQRNPFCEKCDQSFSSILFYEVETYQITCSNLTSSFSGNGYISTQVLREILHELDHKLTEKDMDEIIEECDVGAKGNIDFEDFKALML